MNPEQKLWWRQAESDHSVFVHLRRAGIPECHLLHYLQMATEKLSKVYLWRSGHASPRTHVGFVRFLRALSDRRRDLERIAAVLGFGRGQDLNNWVHSVLPLAYSLQGLAPAEAHDGPNPEYPWPHESSAHCPVDHNFELWVQLVNTGQGRQLIAFIDHAVVRFEQYA
jgi:hypothetical protein